MLETLVAPRIRRTLFEHLVTHPAERFYLRGLAKELSLPVSPLRRELKRLLEAGMLHTVHEGNILFYTIDAASPTFLQLQQAGGPIHSNAPEPSLADSAVQHGDILVSADPAPAGSSAALNPVSPVSRAPIGRSTVSTPLLVATTVVGMSLMLVVAGLSYVSLVHPPRVSKFQVSLKRAQVVHAQSASAVMRGSRWQVTSGGFGGFSSGSNSDPRAIQ